MRSSFLLFTLSENILRGQFIILLTRAALELAQALNIKTHALIRSVLLASPAHQVWCCFYGVVRCGEVWCAHCAPAGMVWCGVVRSGEEW